MKLKKMQVSNYKQLVDTVLFFQDDITILAGPNNSGKTTLNSVMKGIFNDSKFKFTKEDIPIKQANDWQQEFFKECEKFFCKFEGPNEVIHNLMESVMEEDKFKSKFSLSPCEVKIEITYDPQVDDVRKFADYFMDLDEKQHSFYFVYCYIFSPSIFKKLLLDSYDNINLRFKNSLQNNKDRTVVNIKAILLDIFSNSLTESCFFADSKYERRSKMEVSEFKSLFRFKSINAVRTLDDTETDKSKGLSKSIVSLASKNEKWKNTTKELPTIILEGIEGTDVKTVVKETSIVTLENALQSIAETNGGHIGEIALEMDMNKSDVSDLLKKITCAKYQINGLTLNEASQGLGYSNMIYLHLQLEEYLIEIDPLLVNVFLIEEPESHMHPQMQKVFIKYLLNIYNQIGLQGLITTHSNEIVKVSKLENLRVIREVSYFNSEIYDFYKFTNSLKSENVEEKSETENEAICIKENLDLLSNFYNWFFEIGFSEIIFADKVILYEGDTERLYLKKLITLPRFKNLSNQYVSFVQVGGAYAFNYKFLIEFLKIKTLIITDLDYKKTALSINDILSSHSTNSTINNFYKMSNADNIVINEEVEDEEPVDMPTIEELYSWKSDEKNILSSGLIYLAFQEKETYSRTLEEAMIAKFLSIKAYECKPRSEWKKIKDEHKLKIVIPKNHEGEDDSEFSLRDMVQKMSNSKTDFMYSVILNLHSEKMLPTYIEEGLNWLMK
ncbi:MAG: AAA family ATPase [Bacilli bacterium]